jgi:transposase
VDARVEQLQALIEAQQRAHTELQEHLAELRRERDGLRLENAALRAENIELRLQIAALTEKVLDLEARLGANSNNSSKPPSSDGPATKRRRGRGKKRRRGGQPGHRSTARAAILPEHADTQEQVVPECCAHCDAAFKGYDPAPIGRPVYEIPTPKIRLTWYWLHQLECEACGRKTRARAPGTVGQSMYGGNIHAMLAIWVGRFRQSKRLASELFEMLYGLNIPPSSICDMEKRTSIVLEGPVKEVRQHLARAPVVHADETGWRMAKRKAWFWMAATQDVAFCRIDRHRSGEVIRGILGEDYGGVVVADRWSAYVRLDRAFCWAHLLRDFRAMHERFHSEWHGVRLENAARKVLRIHRHWREGEITRAEMLEQMEPLRASIDKLLVWPFAGLSL